jgi:flotillin
VSKPKEPPVTQLPSQSAIESRTRYPDGWRRGKPEEDPEKTKEWGFMSARPSEFLIRMRGGKVVTSGQGATCFKWPWDSVAIVPTSVQRLHFVADQVSSEKVGVKVTGVAVYRIADPLIAYRMLNFSYPERAQEKLSEMMEEMFIGAVRRLVANLTVEHCMTRRKDALAQELMREIAPVVGGVGRVDDQTRKGWGVVVDTIEIQDVRVLSSTVFGNMQAKYREELARSAREAELLRERSVKQNEAEATRQIALTQVAAETEVRKTRETADEESKLEAIATKARVEEAKVAQEKAAQTASLLAKAEFEMLAQQKAMALAQAKQQAAERAQLEAVAAEARLTQARLAAEGARAAQEAEAERLRHQAQLEIEVHAAEVLESKVRAAQALNSLKELELQAFDLELRKTGMSQRVELDRLAAAKAIENQISPEAIQLAVANKLPELALAFQQNMGEVHVTAVDGANPFGYVAAAVEGVLGLARSAGLELPKKPAV